MSTTLIRSLLGGLLVGLTLLAPAARAQTTVPSSDVTIRFEGLAMADAWARTVDSLVEAGIIGTRLVAANGRTYCALFREEFGLPGCPVAIEHLAVHLNGIRPELLMADTQVRVPALESQVESYDRRFATGTQTGRKALARFESQFAPFILARGADSWRGDGVILTLRRVTARFQVVGTVATAKAAAILGALPAEDARFVIAEAPLPGPGRKPARPEPVPVLAAALPGVFEPRFDAVAGPETWADSTTLILTPASLPPVFAGLATAATAEAGATLLANLLPVPVIWGVLDAAPSDPLVLLLMGGLALAAAACLVAGVQAARAVLEQSRIAMARWLVPEVMLALEKDRDAAGADRQAPLAADLEAEAELTRLLARIRHRHSHDHRDGEGFDLKLAPRPGGPPAWMIAQPVGAATSGQATLSAATPDQDDPRGRGMMRARRGLEALVNLPAKPV